MRDNEVYDKEYLAKLGITPDTNPNDPSTWSEDLKKRHSNTVSSLPQEVQKRVKVSPTVEPDGDSQAEVVGNNWKDNISKKYDSLVEQSQARYDGDGEDGRPGKVDPKEWASLTAEQKKGVVGFVRAKRFHDLVRQPENLDVHGAINYDQRIFHGIGPRVDIESAFYPLNAKIKTDAQKAEKAAAHKKARDIVKAYDEWGTNRTDEFLSKKGSDPDGDFEQIENEDFEEPQTTSASTSASFTEPAVEEPQEHSSQRLVTTTDENGHPNILYTAPNGATHEQKAVFGPDGKIAGHFGIWKTQQGKVVGKFGPYALDGDSNPEEQMTAMASTLSEKLNNHIESNPGIYEPQTFSGGMGIPAHFSQGGTPFPSNADLFRQLKSTPVEPTEDEEEDDSTEEPSSPTVEEQNQAEIESGSNVSAQMTEAGVAPALPSQPTATYQSGGSLSWKESLDKFNEWRAAKKVTYKDNGPAIRKIAKEIRAKSPGVVGHLLDLDDKFFSLTNNQRVAEDDPRKELVNNLRAAALSIHSHISDKASSSPDEPATELPQSLRADHLLNETPTIAEGADVGQPDKIDPNLWVTLSPDQKNHVKNYVRLHDKVQSFQLPNGQIAGSDESLSAYNEMHNYRRKLETSFGATGASKVGNEKYDIASKKVFDLLKEYPLGIARVF